MTKASSFSAPGPAAGYLWQVHQALLKLFDLGPGETVELESYDDVVILDRQNEISAAIQTKHSLGPVVGTLTTESPELWKTLRVWSDRNFQDRTGTNTRLRLLTTARIGQGSTLRSLRIGQTPTAVEINALARELDDIARSGSNKKLILAYAAWKKLKHQQKIDLLNRVRISTANKRLAEARNALDDRIERWPIRPEARSAFSNELVGWFLQTVNDRLGPGGCKVGRDEFMASARAISDGLKPGMLIPRHAQMPPPTTLADEWKRSPMYLRQLRIIEIPDREQEDALTDFWRARKELERQTG